MEQKRISPYLTNVVKDYLSKRRIQSKAGNDRRCSVGVPQGSVLGPTLWNIMYDEVFGLETTEGVTLVGYADDVAIVVEDRKWEHVLSKAEDAIRIVQERMARNALELAPEKTELVTLKFGRPRREGVIRVANQEVHVSQSAKYLGVLLDTSVSFGPHIRAAAAKALKAVTSLSRLMPNFGGPGEAKRRMLGAVANSIILYGAPIWADSMNVETYRRLLQSVQRKMALRVCREYRTVSHEAAVVVAAMIPIHLLARERKRIWESDQRTAQLRREERRVTMRLWQEEWDASDKGRWTRRLIKDVAAWSERKHGVVDYYVTQWLTNHGSFKAYVRRIGKLEDDRCESCDEVDTAEHVVYRCKRWERDRAELNSKLGVVLTVDNTIEIMLRGSKEWTEISNMVRKIMAVKETEGR